MDIHRPRYNGRLSKITLVYYLSHWTLEEELNLKLSDTFISSEVQLKGWAKIISSLKFFKLL